MTKKGIWLSVYLLGILLGSIIGYTIAQSSNTFYISSGIYPNASTYTFWIVDSIYYSKTAYGILSNNVDATILIQNALNSMTHGDSIFFKRGNYYITYLTKTISNLSISGEYGANIISSYNGKIFQFIGDNNRIENIQINGELAIYQRNLLTEIPVTVGNQTYKRIVNNRMVKLNDDRLLASFSVYDRGETQKEWEWWQKYSVDNGLTWLPSYRVEDNTSSYGVFPCGSIYKSSTNELWVFHGHWYYFTAEAGAKKMELWYRKSTDYGVTWSADTNVTTTHSYMAASYEGLELISGRLIIPIWWWSSYTGGVHVWSGAMLYSDNNGVTWTEGNAIPSIPLTDSTNNFDEPMIEQLPNGDLIVILRTIGIGNEDKKHWKSTSVNNGVTWSQPTAISEISSYDTVAGIIRLSNDYLLLAYIERTSGSTFDRRPLKIAVSKDNGTSWCIIKTLDSLGSHYNANEAEILELSDGRIYVYYWRYGYFNFNGGYSNIKDICVVRSFYSQWLEIPQSDLTYGGYGAWEGL